MHRACTEKGLWETLCAGIAPPAPRSNMVHEYLDLYRAGSEQLAGLIA
jgi:hypothetical protein